MFWMKGEVLHRARWLFFGFQRTSNLKFAKVYVSLVRDTVNISGPKHSIKITNRFDCTSIQSM